MKLEGVQINKILDLALVGVIVLGAMLTLVYLAFFQQDWSKCAYKVTGNIQGSSLKDPISTAYNITDVGINGELSGEVYCRDITKIAVAMANK